MWFWSGSYYLPSFTFDVVAGFTSDGYQAGAAYMAVHPAWAELGVLHRHHLAMTGKEHMFTDSSPPSYDQAAAALLTAPPSATRR